MHAHRKADSGGAALVRSERYQGEFTRSFVLGEHYDMDHVSATLQNGVLTVRVARRPESRPRRIPIRLGAEAASKLLSGKPAEAQALAVS
ncbi:Hsp20 family protein [Sorangium sp. So ce1036]|uniref:Hsp20/alpha crystallin family protein n=1 Tax=Sorangium sp. So ce1036 TaxID=3133328 RepID=UPI003F005E9A